MVESMGPDPSARFARRGTSPGPSCGVVRHPFLRAVEFAMPFPDLQHSNQGALDFEPSLGLAELEQGHSLRGRISKCAPGAEAGHRGPVLSHRVEPFRLQRSVWLDLITDRDRTAPRMMLMTTRRECVSIEEINT